MPLLISVVVPAGTAILSVILTVWLYQKRDKLNALRALRSEAEQNKEAAESIHTQISGDIILREEGNERPPSLGSFSTHAFQNIKNRGVLARLPEGTRNTISEHYTLLEFTNHQLQYRQQMRATSRALSGFNELMNSLDLVIQLKLNTLGVADLERLPLEGDVEDIENISDEGFNFDDVIEAVDAELEEHLYLGKII